MRLLVCKSYYIRRETVVAIAWYRCLRSNKSNKINEMEKSNSVSSDLNKNMEDNEGNLLTLSEFNKLSAQHNKVEDWEFQAVGSFLVDLYKRNIISRTENWYFTKLCARQEFELFLNAVKNQGLRQRLNEKLGKFNIGNLMDRSKLLINTKRGSSKYRLNYEALFGAEMLAIMDNQQLSNKQFNYNDDARSTIENNDIAESEDWQLLNCKGTHMEKLQSNASISQWHCYLCQMNFDTSLKYRYHAQEHSAAKQYAWTKDLEEYDTSILIVHAKLHTEENKLLLKLKCVLPIANRLLLDKVFLAKTYNCCSILKSPIKLSTKTTIEIDANMLNDSNEQAFVFILRDVESDSKHIAEQHHYVRKIVLQNAKNYKVYKHKDMLINYLPREELSNLPKNKMDINVLKKYSQEFADYINNDKKYTMQNIHGALRFLLEIEDTDFYNTQDIVQLNVQLERKGDEYLFKITSDKYNCDYLLNNNIEICLCAVNTKTEPLNRTELIIIASPYYCFEHVHNTEQKIYVGPVKCVENGYMSIKLDKKIPLDQKYTLIERRSRFELRLQYRALERMKQLSVFDMNRFLFPQFVAEQDLPNTRPDLCNVNIYKDIEQLQAVQNILAGPHKDATYIIEGPSGSGKTTVIVESILQLYKFKPESKILALATNESACDQLALPIIEKLKEMSKLQEITRIYSHLHNTKEMSNSGKQQFRNSLYPAVEFLHQQRIVVCTLSVAGYLSLNNFGRDCNGRHIFSHIFVDNAGGVTEPELMMGLINMLSSQARLILSGDFKQTAPTVHSKRANALGFGISLMQRLLQRECYKLDNLFNPCSNAVHTRLRHNYRSHPEIVQICDRLFRFKVISSCDIVEYKSFTKWHRLRNPYCPVIFHHVSAKLNTCNFLALDLILSYVKELIYFGVEGKEIKEEDIGIIINSHSERIFLNDEFIMRGWTKLEVNYADQFCGREKNIIICLLPLFGTQMHRKKFYFILMRAKTMLIFVGDETYAKNNECLTEFISICQSRKILIDSEISESGSSVDKLILPNDETEKENKSAQKPLKYKKQIQLARQLKTKCNVATKLTKSSDMMKEMVADAQRANTKKIADALNEQTSKPTQALNKTATSVGQNESNTTTAQSALKDLKKAVEEKINHVKPNVSALPLASTEIKQQQNHSQQQKHQPKAQAATSINPQNVEIKQQQKVTQNDLQQQKYQPKAQPTPNQQQFTTRINQQNVQQYKAQVPLPPIPRYHAPSPASPQLQQQFANNYLQQSQYHFQQQHQIPIQAMPYHPLQQPIYQQAPPQQPVYQQVQPQQSGYYQGPYVQYQHQQQPPKEAESVATKAPTAKRTNNNEQKNSCEIC